MLQYAGYENAYIKDNEMYFDMTEYERQVNLYYFCNEEWLLEEICEYSKRTSRISYKVLSDILGSDYPKIAKNIPDNKVSAIVLLKSMGYIFRFDDSAIYML